MSVITDFLEMIHCVS